MPTPITASMLYDLVQCPHRVTMDLFGASKDRDEINPFIQLLWEKGSLHEQNVIGDISEPFLDLSIYAGDEKERRITEALARGEPLIVGGRIQIDDLLGDPDLLRKHRDGYVAGGWCQANANQSPKCATSRFSSRELTPFSQGG